MSSIKLFTITALAFILWSCGNHKDSKKNNFSIETNAKNNTILLGETLKLSIKNPNNIVINAITYKIITTDVSDSFIVENLKLGVQNITATITYNNTSQEIKSKITILNNKQPKIYTYKIINEYPHDITSYTQGLEFYNGNLYESTGQYGESKLRKVNYKTAEVLENINIPRQYFGEGLTVLKNNIYLLTWQEKIGFVYDATTFEKKNSFTYGQSKEGWGICNDGNTLYKSDGTENIWLLNSETQVEENKIQAYHNKGKVIGLNELEWVNGKIYANRYQLNGVAIINPTNGGVEGVIDFSPLKKLVKQHPGLDVLNGIAYNPETKTIFVTGKRWNKIFEIEVLEK